MTKLGYGYERTLNGRGFAATLERVVEVLGEQGFGVLSDIDVQAALKKKLGVDRRPYRILGACMPPLAHRALQNEPLLGLLLPCNVVVAERDDGSVSIGVIDAKAMFQVVDNPDLQPIAAEVDAKLRAALEAV
jgi:uncharacterized protein (DUF302 family)